MLRADARVSPHTRKGRQLNTDKVPREGQWSKREEVPIFEVRPGCQLPRQEGPLKDDEGSELEFRLPTRGLRGEKSVENSALIDWLPRSWTSSPLPYPRP